MAAEWAFLRFGDTVLVVKLLFAIDYFEAARAG